MPIDIDDFRKFKGGDPEKIRESERRRFHPVEVVDSIIEADETWRKLRGNNDDLRKQKRALGNKVRDLIKAGKKDEAAEARKNMKEANTQIDQKIKEQERIATEAAAKRDSLLHTIGNYVHDSVPVGDDEDKFNKIVRTWGLETKRGAENNDTKANPGGGKEGALLHHHELLSRIDGFEPERGVRVAGHRAYFLKNAGVALNFALQTYAQHFLSEKGYSLLQTPYFMDKKQMGLVAELADYNETLYHVETGHPNDSKYLIATSEQPICLYHAGEWLNEKELKEKPLFYGGVSTCFRKEAGKTGVDNWGIFRVHQFEKIEQFCVCHPEDSWAIHEKMIAQAEAFTLSLGLPYQVIAICSGELNNAAAKKYDLEAWFPGYVEVDTSKGHPHPGMRELVSCSNCLDYQSRAVEIRCGQPPSKHNKNASGHKGKKVYAHMLNSTLCATTRVICCILENYQTPEGVLVPEKLLPYVNPTFVKTDSKGRKHIPYLQEVKINYQKLKAEEGKKKKGKSKGKKGGDAKKK
mmetsp:Transcript_4997/g.9214  ORF Transcript_4997/g.9214 Transcript_4997/m.9214 type:complete len:522 (+) Transcript_4997:1305-2870(+)|eukprot:CAMPEP_0197515900 /NCGR_PEP_ID=MMETSP1318-20131121/866_1 /TAXON_ID=552666 /ORGANISM="Partenskyella glossopodia, Strain RCC365" /LENGTH=521 /DNA_ID=CAMNT_0043064375 /DNA_START=180 /DNA_END=1745 /DNA_ORIENTATION=-